MNAPQGRIPSADDNNSIVKRDVISTGNNIRYISISTQFEPKGEKQDF